MYYLPDNLDKSVGFLCQQAEDDDQPIPRATAFVVSVYVGGDTDVPILITAKHNLTQARRTDAPLILRMNNRDGTVIEAELPDDRWAIHDSFDVAACWLPSRPESTPATSFKDMLVGPHFVPDLGPIPASLLATDATIASERIRPGDEVCFVGLFSQHAGRDHILPVLRFGNISLMADEPVPLRLEPGTITRQRSILVEARSWGGHSGSPAFVFYPPNRRSNSVHIGQTGRLLGLVSGHFDLPAFVQYESDINGDLDPRARVNLNAGMACVTPAQAILEVLSLDPVAEDIRGWLTATEAAQKASTPEMQAKLEALLATGQFDEAQRPMWQMSLDRMKRGSARIATGERPFVLANRDSDS